jgi:PAS domain-containing protein
MSFNKVSMPIWHEKHLRAATTAAGVALWSWNVDTDAITMDERAYDLWEVSKDEKQITFEILSQNIHPADLERVRSAFAATRCGRRRLRLPGSIRHRYSLDLRSGSGRRRGHSRPGYVWHLPRRHPT